MNFKQGNIYVHDEYDIASPKYALVLESSNDSRCWILTETGKILLWGLSRTLRTEISGEQSNE